MTRQSQDVCGFRQALGVLGIACLTGMLTFWLWRSGHWWLALPALVAHCNVCCMFLSGVHDLIHRSCFKTARLNSLFMRVFSFLYWMDGEKDAVQHWSHHGKTLHDNDLGLPDTCRPLWAGSVLWVGLFNLPRFVQVLRKCSLWILAGHALLAAVFILCGLWELLFLVTLAPFSFGWLLFLTLYPQHAAMKLNHDDMRESTRSLTLPSWLSFLNWHGEYHLEHHLHPHVPCYQLAALSRELGDTIPAPQTLWQAWRDILKKRQPGECGYGDNPLKLLLNKAKAMRS